MARNGCTRQFVIFWLVNVTNFSPLEMSRRKIPNNCLKCSETKKLMFFKLNFLCPELKLWAETKGKNTIEAYHDKKCPKKGWLKLVKFCLPLLKRQLLSQRYFSASFPIVVSYYPFRRSYVEFSGDLARKMSPYLIFLAFVLKNNCWVLHNTTLGWQFQP